MEIDLDRRMGQAFTSKLGELAHEQDPALGCAFDGMKILYETF